MSPLASWFADETQLARFRARRLGREPVVLPPRDRAWRAVAPGFDAAVALAASGVPFQIAADRRYDRAGDPRRLRDALAAGKTIFLPQVHQVLPRLMRLMVALRAALLGPAREECSFLFVVQGTGRPGMGLHHDGEVHSFWLQLEGRRTVTVGPPVSRDAPQELPDRLAGDARAASDPAGFQEDHRKWWTCDLAPGTLFHLPPRTPHRVICHGRSLAISLTWAVPRRRAAAQHARGLASRDRTRLLAWDVVSGYAETVPPRSRTWLWTQMPALAGVADDVKGTGGTRAVWTAEGQVTRIPSTPGRLLAQLPRMPRIARGVVPLSLDPLLDAGILAPRDLPLRIVPDDPAALDGWRFA